tara:strand:- start:86 stop:256 length:171 start_codon:yes stop_codon:yes gene_type:complete
VAENRSSENGGIGKVVGGPGEEMLIPRLGSEGDEREIFWDAEVFLCHPGKDGEGLS